MQILALETNVLIRRQDKISILKGFSVSWGNAAKRSLQNTEIKLKKKVQGAVGAEGREPPALLSWGEED